MTKELKKLKVSDIDKTLMTLMHFFITKKGYCPINVKGAVNEIYLENPDEYYKIVRINSEYIHNIDQFNLDLNKVRFVAKQVKKKNFLFKYKVLNLCLNIGEDVKTYSEKFIDCINVESYNKMINNDLLNNVFTNFKEEVYDKEDGMDLMFKITEDINKTTEEHNKKYSAIFNKKKIIFTPLLIELNILIFILMYIFGKGSEDISTLIAFGANNKNLVLNGEIWRLFTSMFLHNGILHLAVNMYSLYIVGTELENVLGKIKFLGIYLISGIVGSMLSLVFAEQFVIGVGASGAIFGLLGALLYFGYHYRVYLNGVLYKQLLPVIIINLAIGFSISGIDNAAHIGGLVGGLFACIAFGLGDKTDKSERINGAISLLVLIGFLGYLIFR